MAVFHGVGINFGIGSDIYNVSGVFQTRNHAYKMNSEEIKDASDATVSKVYWDLKQEATFTYIAAVNYSVPYGDAIVYIPEIGKRVWITDTKYYQITGNDWLVDEISTYSSNTSAMKVTLNLSRYPKLTPTS